MVCKVAANARLQSKANRDDIIDELSTLCMYAEDLSPTQPSASTPFSSSSSATASVSASASSSASSSSSSGKHSNSSSKSSHKDKKNEQRSIEEKSYNNYVQAILGRGPLCRATVETESSLSRSSSSSSNSSSTGKDKEKTTTSTNSSNASSDSNNSKRKASKDSTSKTKKKKEKNNKKSGDDISGQDQTKHYKDRFVQRNGRWVSLNPQHEHLNKASKRAAASDQDNSGSGQSKDKSHKKKKHNQQDEKKGPQKQDKLGSEGSENSSGLGYVRADLDESNLITQQVFSEASRLFYACKYSAIEDATTLMKQMTTCQGLASLSLSLSSLSLFIYIYISLSNLLFIVAWIYIPICLYTYPGEEFRLTKGIRKQVAVIVKSPAARQRIRSMIEVGRITDPMNPCYAGEDQTVLSLRLRSLPPSLSLFYYFVVF